MCDEVSEFQSDNSFTLKTSEEAKEEKEKEVDLDCTKITMKEHVYLEFHDIHRF